MKETGTLYPSNMPGNVMFVLKKAKVIRKKCFSGLQRKCNRGKGTAAEVRRSEISDNINISFVCLLTNFVECFSLRHQNVKVVYFRILG